MRVEIVEGLFLGKVFPVLEIGQGDHAGQYFLDVGALHNGERRGSWFDAERCSFVGSSHGNEYLIFDKKTDLKLAWVRALDLHSVEQFALKNSFNLADIVINECDFRVSDDFECVQVLQGHPLFSLVSSGGFTCQEVMAYKIYKQRGQRGKGKKQAAVLVSLRIPPDLLKMIDDKAALNGLDRTAMILSILARGY